MQMMQAKHRVSLSSRQQSTPALLKARRTVLAAHRALPSKLQSSTVPTTQNQATPRRYSVVAAAGKVQKISGEQLEVEIQDRDKPLIVDFFATWCGPCLLLAKELEKVAEELGDEVKVLKIDVDENPVLSSQLRIEGLPTIVFIPKDSSRPALRTEGLLPAAQIIDIVKDISKPAA